MIEKPPILTGDEAHQIKQLHTYLYRLITEIDRRFDDFDKADSQMQTQISALNSANEENE